jgi:hypothetical protein
VERLVKQLLEQDGRRELSKNLILTNLNQNLTLQNSTISEVLILGWKGFVNHSARSMIGNSKTVLGFQVINPFLEKRMENAKKMLMLTKWKKKRKWESKKKKNLLILGQEIIIKWSRIF